MSQKILTFRKFICLLLLLCLLPVYYADLDTESSKMEENFTSPMEKEKQQQQQQQQQQLCLPVYFNNQKGRMKRLRQPTHPRILQLRSGTIGKAAKENNCYQKQSSEFLSGRNKITFLAGMVWSIENNVPLFHHLQI